MALTCETTVDKYGCISPTFEFQQFKDGATLPSWVTRGSLKYFSHLANRRVRITVELIDEEES